MLNGTIHSRNTRTASGRLRVSAWIRTPEKAAAKFIENQYGAPESLPFIVVLANTTSWMFPRPWTAFPKVAQLHDGVSTFHADYRRAGDVPLIMISQECTHMELVDAYRIRKLDETTTRLHKDKEEVRVSVYYE